VGQETLEEALDGSSTLERSETEHGGLSRNTNLVIRNSAANTGWGEFQGYPVSVNPPYEHAFGFKEVRRGGINSHARRWM